jgi:peptidoglycan/xylan/chitin deacetylase (PgdA/CDA1 family)
MTGRPGPNTRRLVAEEGGFLYDRDSLADELPYWLRMESGPHLVIPYSYEANDNRFNENAGFSTGADFFTYMRDAFDCLYREGVAGSPKLLSIGLHDRLIGRPGRAWRPRCLARLHARLRRRLVLPGHRRRPALASAVSARLRPQRQARRRLGVPTPDRDAGTRGPRA